MKKVLSIIKYILCSVFILSSVLITPFSIYGDYYNIAPFVGINYYIEEYDNENRVSMNSGSSNISLSGSQSNTLLVQRTTNGVTYVTSTYSQGGVSGNGGTISLSGNVNLSSSLTNTQVVYRVVHFTIVLDDNYIGYIRPRVTKTGNTTNLFQQDLAVNGNSVEFSIVDNDISTTATYSVTWSDFSLVLNKDYNFNFPIESFSAVNYLLDDPSVITGLQGFPYLNYVYPVFHLQKNGYACRVNPISQSNPGVFIFGLSDNSNTVLNLGNFNNTFYWSQNDVVITDFQRISPFGSKWGIYKVVFYSPSTNNVTLRINKEVWLMPIYSNVSSNIYVSTDFALQYGLTNQLLNNLDTIANGTTSSNQSSSNADSSNSQLSDEISNYNQVEQQLTGDFQNNLNAINVDSPLNILGSGFVQSANWVRTQFDTLTNNNPFGSLLTFSLILGVGLLIIGKVFG